MRRPADACMCTHVSRLRVWGWPSSSRLRRGRTPMPPDPRARRWGIVVEGELSLTIGRETRTYRRGDEYFIPAGTPHSARLPRGLRVIDVFDDPDRFRARP